MGTAGSICFSLFHTNKFSTNNSPPWARIALPFNTMDVNVEKAVSYGYLVANGSNVRRDFSKNVSFQLRYKTWKDLMFLKIENTLTLKGFHQTSAATIILSITPHC